MFVELGHLELSNCHGIYAVDQGRRSFREGGLPPTRSCRVLRTLRCGGGRVTPGWRPRRPYPGLLYLSLRGLRTEHGMPSSAVRTACVSDRSRFRRCMFVGRRSQRTSESARRIAVRSGFVGHRSPRCKKRNRARPEVSQSGSWRRLGRRHGRLCPSQDARGTTLGQLVGQISDVLSTAYAICPRISRKKEQLHIA